MSGRCQQGTDAKSGSDQTYSTALWYSTRVAFSLRQYVTISTAGTHDDPTGTPGGHASSSRESTFKMTKLDGNSGQTSKRSMIHDMFQKISDQNITTWNFHPRSESMWELIPVRTSWHRTRQTARRETDDIVDEQDLVSL